MDMRTYSIGFTITTDIEKERLKKFLQKLGEHPDTERMSFIKIELKRPPGRPRQVGAEILQVLEVSSKPLSNAQLQRKLDKNQKSIYYAMMRLLKQGLVRYVEDEQYGCKRFYLTAREEELETKLSLYKRMDFSKYDNHSQ